MKLLSLTIIATLGLAACSTASAGSPHHSHYKPAPQGYWKLNPRKCPDLVEDYRDRRESRIDEAYDRNRRDVYEDRLDRRESRRDEAVTNCPRSAWEWHGPKYKAHYHAPRPKVVKVYYNAHKKHYYHKPGHGHKYGHKRGHGHVTINW